MFDRALEKRYLICSHDGPRWDCTTLRLCPLFFPPRVRMMAVFWLVAKHTAVVCVFLFKRCDVMRKELEKL